MRDVVLNRRILVVNLPALENSDATLAALGKLVVASLRGMMAQLLGASLEGDYTEADKPGMGPAPFPVVFDELAYYATSGLDRMLAMGRGLNISFMLGFQEVSGIWARLGEKTASLLGNANLTIAMRQQDSGRTREWIEKTAGQTYVTQATAYHGAGDGNYREARHAEVRPVSRVDWNDLTTLIEGEAIVLFGGRRIYARLFHAQIDDTGPKRLGRSLMLRAPRPRRGARAARPDRPDRRRHRRRQSGRRRRGRDLARAGGALARVQQGRPRRRRCARLCAGRACRAAHGFRRRCCLADAPAPADGTPVTAVTPMLSAASLVAIGGAETTGLPNEPLDDGLLRAIAAAEMASGVPASSARAAALAILAERDGALAKITAIEPPAMSVETLQGHLRAVMRTLAALRGAAAPRRVA